MKITDQGARDLAAAICINAARDYKEALRTDNKAEAARCENFFRSAWFQALSGIIDGERAIQYLRDTREVVKYEGFERRH